MTRVSHPVFEQSASVERSAWGHWPRPDLALALVAAWISRHRQRRALDHLDERLLRDVGLAPAEVRRECDKPFWRP